MGRGGLPANILMSLAIESWRVLGAAVMVSGSPCRLNRSFETFRSISSIVNVVVGP